MSSPESSPLSQTAPVGGWQKTLRGFGMPVLALITAFVLGAVVIWITSGKPGTVLVAYGGLADGALFKQRGLSESLIATTPYILGSLAVALGFKAGLFNIGAEGQFYIGALASVWVGYSFSGLPAIVHLPLALLVGALGGAAWAAIPAYLKARTGAHEVITTIMGNYVAFRLTEYLVNGPMKDRTSTVPKTPDVAVSAQLWRLWEIPHRLQDPLNALGAAIVLGLVTLVLTRWVLGWPGLRARFKSSHERRPLMYGIAVGVTALSFFALPLLTRTWWPFMDDKDRLNIGLLLAVAAAVFTWWLLYRTTIGFGLRTLGANPDAARYAGINVGRNIVLALVLSGALAGLAGTVEILGLEHNLPVFFSSGYGFDSIAIALVAQNDPFGILVAAFLFGAMRNGADLMELRSGVSKYVISLLQALVLLFVAAPAMVSWLYRLKGQHRDEDEAPLTRGWGG
jgi:general nucleoside transport system permease protein